MNFKKIIPVLALFLSATAFTSSAFSEQNFTYIQLLDLQRENSRILSERKQAEGELSQDLINKLMDLQRDIAYELTGKDPFPPPPPPSADECRGVSFGPDNTRASSNPTNLYVGGSSSFVQVSDPRGATGISRVGKGLVRGKKYVICFQRPIDLDKVEVRAFNFPRRTSGEINSEFKIYQAEVTYDNGNTDYLDELTRRQDFGANDHTDHQVYRTYNPRMGSEDSSTSSVRDPGVTKLVFYAEAFGTNDAVAQFIFYSNVEGYEVKSKEFNESFQF